MQNFDIIVYKFYLKYKRKNYFKNLFLYNIIFKFLF